MELKAQNEDLESKIKDIREKREKTHIDHAAQVNSIQQEHERLRQELQAKKNQENQAASAFQKDLEQAERELEEER